VACEVMWAPWEGPGLEHLRLVTSDGGVVANGLVIGPEMSLLRIWEASGSLPASRYCRLDPSLIPPLYSTHRLLSVTQQKPGRRATRKRRRGCSRTT
jgi:hypothetical protein